MEVVLKTISFSLWGSEPRYLNGVEANEKLAKKYYPDFLMRVIKRPAAEGWRGLFWRMDVCSKEGIWLIRDLDSRINAREAAAVRDWLSSPYDYHVMRDHDNHKSLIMGGLFGGKKPIPGFKKLLETYPFKDNYYDDQNFLNECIWPIIEEDTLVHGRGGIPFPEHESIAPDSFVGQRHNWAGVPEL